MLQDESHVQIEIWVFEPFRYTRRICPNYFNITYVSSSSTPTPFFILFKYKLYKRRTLLPDTAHMH